MASLDRSRIGSNEAITDKARLGPGLGRPKGMHVTTFKSLLSIIRKCEEARDSASYLALQRMGLM